MARRKKRKGRRRYGVGPRARKRADNPFAKIRCVHGNPGYKQCQECLKLTSRDVYRRASLHCKRCGRSNFLTSKGLNDHIRRAHVRGSVKRAYARAGKRRGGRSGAIRTDRVQKQKHGPHVKVYKILMFSDDLASPAPEQFVGYVTAPTSAHAVTQAISRFRIDPVDAQYVEAVEAFAKPGKYTRGGPGAQAREKALYARWLRQH